MYFRSIVTSSTLMLSKLYYHPQCNFLRSKLVGKYVLLHDKIYMLDDTLVHLKIQCFNTNWKYGYHVFGIILLHLKIQRTDRKLTGIGQLVIIFRLVSTTNWNCSVEQGSCWPIIGYEFGTDTDDSKLMCCLWPRYVVQASEAIAE